MASARTLLCRVTHHIVMAFEPVTSFDFEALACELVKVECRVLARRGVMALMPEFTVFPITPEIGRCSCLVQEGKGK